MNRVLARCSLCALFAGSALACADEGSVGGLTASIEFAPLSGRTSRAVELTDGPSTKRSLLRTAEVPEIVDRLQIVALDTNGSTLAETNLYIEPTGDQLPLFRAGGTWTLSGVPAGDDRRLAGRAYLGANTDPRLDGALVYTGQIDGITVTAGQTTDAGVLLLSPGPIRVPEADEQQPPPPARPEAVVRPEGGALDVSWQAPDATDVAGYVVAVATMPTDDEAPTIARETILQVGDRLPEASAYGVVAIIDANAPRAISLDGLPNGVAIAVLLFAYDTTVDGAPLNYSPPALVFGTPQDTIAPGPVVGLTAERLDDGFAITFTAPGEDGPNDADGTPARYEVRTSSAADLLMDAAGFERAQGVRSPPVAMPGESVRFTRSAQDVGVNVGQDRYVGVRGGRCRRQHGSDPRRDAHGPECPASRSRTTAAEGRVRGRRTGHRGACVWRVRGHGHRSGHPERDAHANPADSQLDGPRIARRRSRGDNHRNSHDSNGQRSHGSNADSRLGSTR